jgi:hypothetical protein
VKNRTRSHHTMFAILCFQHTQARNFSQMIRSHMGHAPPPQASQELSEQAIQSVDACLAVAEKTFGRQRVDEDGRPLKLHEDTADGKPESDEGIGLYCPMDKIDDSSEVPCDLQTFSLLWRFLLVFA